MLSNELVQAYFRYRKTQAEVDFWAWDQVTDLVLADPDRGWEAALALVRAAQGPEELAYVAAGPLEDLLATHGPRIWDTVKGAAAVDPRVKEALRRVWGQKRIEPRIYAELRGI